MNKTCQNCFGWGGNSCTVLRGRLPVYPSTCHFWKHKNDVDRDKIEHDILVYAGLRAKGGD